MASSIAAASAQLHRTPCNAVEDCKGGGGRIEGMRRLMREIGERRGRRELMSAFCMREETVGAHPLFRSGPTY